MEAGTSGVTGPAKDFATADAIRAQLTEMGVEVTDTPQGPVWKKV